MKKIFDALVDGSVALISRFLPDAYILVLLLTVILFVVAVPVTGIAPAEGITVADRLVNLVYDGWYGGFWNLLGFGMQMVLIVVTGTMFANTEPVHRIIVKIASIPKTPRQALLLVSAVGMVAYFLQWGAALIVCAVLAQEVAKQVKGIHYPLLVAAAYVGNAFCLVGISGTIALNVAGGWTFDGVWSTTGIPFRETVFAPYNLFIYLVGAIVLCLLITAMHPSPEKTKTVDPAIFAEETVEKQYRPRSEMTPAEKLETSVLLNGLIAFIGFFCVIWSFVDSLYIKKQSFSLSINQVNMIFLFASIAMYKTPVRTVAAVKISGRSGWRCASDAVLCRNCRIDQLSRRFNRCFHRTGDCRIFCTYFQCADLSALHLPERGDRKAVCTKRRSPVGGSGADCNAGGPELYAGCVGRKGSNGTFLGQFLL